MKKVETLSFESIYSENFNMFVNRLRMRGVRYEVAEDLVQNSFLKLYESNMYFDFRTKEDFIKVMYKIVDRTHIDHTRLLKNDVKSFEPNYDKGTNNNPLAILIDKDNHTKLNKLLNELSPKKKTIADLLFSEEKSYDEISHILNIPIGTVCGTIARLKTELSSKFILTEC